MKKDKKLKLPIRRILSDNLYVLRLINKAAPNFMLQNLMLIAASATVGFFTGTYLFRYALNGINKGKSFWEIAAFILVCFVLGILIQVANTVFYRRVYDKKRNNVLFYMQKAVYEKANSLELGCYENPKFYEHFVKAVDECQASTDRVMNAVNSLVYRAVAFVTNFSLIIVVDPWLLVFVIIPLLVSPLRSKSNKLGYARTMDTKEVNRVRDYSRRVFYLSDYAKEMRLTKMSPLMIERFRESVDKNLKILKKYGLSIATLDYIVSQCNNVLSSLGATVYAVWKTVVKKTMGYGDCVTIVNSIEQIAYILSDTAKMLYDFQETALYIETLREFMEYEPKIKSGDEILPDSGDIVFENVSFRYDGAENYTLRNVNMRFGKNEKIAIVGHNGAGKTTLTKLLLRLYDAEGSISYGGVDIKKLPLDDYRSIFSAVMQDYHIFALTVAENVILGKTEPQNKNAVEEALKKGGIYEKVAAMPDGIDTVLTREFDKDGIMLSGGEQQKLAISHVYSKNNRFVILDEPSSALDPIAEYEMYEKMLSVCENCGMIFISHRLSSAVMADRIYLMENGTVTESGTHSELMCKNGRYAEMFRRQAENYAEVSKL